MNTPGDDTENSPILRDIEELIAEVGLRAFLSACARSSAGEHVGATTTQRALQIVIREIAFADNPQLEAEIMALGAGIILDEKGTQTRIGEKHGLSRAAICKRVVAFIDRTGLPPSQFMKSAAARKNYALTNQPRTA